MLSRTTRKRLKTDEDYADWLNKITDEIFLHVNDTEDKRSWTKICADANLSYGTFTKLRTGETMYPRAHTLLKLARTVGYDIQMVQKVIRMHGRPKPKAKKRVA